MRPETVHRSLRRWRATRGRPSERVALVSAVLTLVLGTVWSIVDDNTEVKVAGVVIIVMVLASLVLGTRALLVVLVVVAGCVGAVFAVHGVDPSQLSISGVVMVLVVAVVMIVQAQRRDRLGLRQVSAETVIGLIRDRLQVQSRLPEVGDGWDVQVDQRPADGAAISGDFVAVRLVGEGAAQVLHVAVVDVSGSGITAGPRALLLSGAVGGLLGSVPPEEFLPATNGYLARQQWSLGFASAIYLVLELATGQYTVRAAGHPPALHFRPASAPPWRISTAAGTVLGVLPTLTGSSDGGVLQPGEALVLYTDGIVEDRTRDLDVGTRGLQDAVERAVRTDGWDGLGSQLVQPVPGASADDRTVVLIRRELVPAELTASSGPEVSRG